MLPPDRCLPFLITIDGESSNYINAALMDVSDYFPSLDEQYATELLVLGGGGRLIHTYSDVE